MEELDEDRKADGVLATSVGWTHLQEFQGMLLGHPPVQPSVWGLVTFHLPQGTSWGCEVPRFTAAPRWEDAGHLIEWFSELPGDGLMPNEQTRRFDSYLSSQYWPSSLRPERIVQAARLALGLGGEVADPEAPLGPTWRHTS